jgi:hypothetical protein
MLVFTAVIAACVPLAARTPVSQVDSGVLYTQAAQTLEAHFTQQAYEEVVAQLTQVSAQLTPTSSVVDYEPTATLAVSATNTQPAPTATLAPPTSTSVPPTNTPVPRPCDAIEFVKDVTVPDGTSFVPGAYFTKIWQVRNAGTCTWTSSYSLVFSDGDRMGAPKSMSLPREVRPGEAVDLSIYFTAPGSSGRHRGYWMLSNAGGSRFGLGAKADTAFWVDIRVLAGNSGYNYDFAAYACAASWKTRSGNLLCPSNTSAQDGSIALLDRPVLENGRHEDELTLWTRPDAKDSGWISGIYPEYKVRANDHFLADIGCLDGNKNCAVLFELSYQTPNGAVSKLGEWYQEYDGQIARIDFDLSGLVGQTVKFILTVQNRGKPAHASAFWLAPSIRTGSPPPTPTPTPTATQMPTPTFTPTATEDPADNPAVDAAHQKLAQDLGLEIDAVSVTMVEAVEWNDTCLGVSLPDMVCAPMIVPGYRVVMQTVEKVYEAHTNQDGSTVFWFER